MRQSEVYRLDPSWIAERNCRVRRRILIEVAALFGALLIVLAVGGWLSLVAALIAACLLGADLYGVVVRQRLDAAAQIEILDKGLRIHSLVHDPILLPWKTLRMRSVESDESGVSALVLAMASPGDDFRIEGYENLAELNKAITGRLAIDA